MTYNRARTHPHYLNENDTSSIVQKVYIFQQLHRIIILNLNVINSEPLQQPFETDL